MVRSGEMRHQISIQSRSATVDAAGEQTLAWDQFALVRAAVQRTPGSEVWAGSQREGRIPVVFRIRYLDGVRPDMRVIFDGKVHNIVSPVDQEGRGEELILVTEELVGEAP